MNANGVERSVRRRSRMDEANDEEYIRGKALQEAARRKRRARDAVTSKSHSGQA